MTKKAEIPKRPAPFFAFTCKAESESAFRFFLDEVDFRGFVSGWKDKNGKLGITLVDKDNCKQATIICLKSEDKPRCLQMIQEHMTVMGY